MEILALDKKINDELAAMHKCIDDYALITKEIDNAKSEYKKINKDLTGTIETTQNKIEELETLQRQSLKKVDEQIGIIKEMETRISNQQNRFIEKIKDTNNKFQEEYFEKLHGVNLRFDSSDTKVIDMNSHIESVFDSINQNIKSRINEMDISYQVLNKNVDRINSELKEANKEIIENSIYIKNLEVKLGNSNNILRITIAVFTVALIILTIIIMMRR